MYQRLMTSRLLFVISNFHLPSRSFTTIHYFSNNFLSHIMIELLVCTMHPINDCSIFTTEHGDISLARDKIMRFIDYWKVSVEIKMNTDTIHNYLKA